jgi:hypothetical protein
VNQEGIALHCKPLPRSEQRKKRKKEEKASNRIQIAETKP